MHANSKKGPSKAKLGQIICRFCRNSAKIKFAAANDKLDLSTKRQRQTANGISRWACTFFLPQLTQQKEESVAQALSQPVKT